MRRTVVLGLFLLLILGACASPKTWLSTPAVGTAENAYFKAELEPLKSQSSFYEGFRLTLKNKTDGDLELAWALTHYVLNNQRKGTFVWRGINPKEASAPPSDVIKAGSTLSKVICPFSLVAWAPLRDQSVDPGESGISCGMVPEGENGISLVVKQKEKEVKERISVKITAQ